MSKRNNTQSKSLSNGSMADDMQLLKPAPQKAKQSNHSAAKPSPKTKTDRVLAHLRRAKGATLAQLMASTGWQAHSVRAVICALRKQGISIVRAKAKNGVTLYRAEKA